jgi:hypothetical protein
MFDDELAALADGRKAMSVFEFDRAQLLFGQTDDQYVLIADHSSKNGLVLVHDTSNKKSRVTRVFCLRLDQLWRVSAYIALKNAHETCRWSDGAEALESSLLGYDDAAIATWLDYMRKSSVGWGIATLHFLISDEHKPRIVEVGNRYFPEQLHGGLTVVEVRNCNVLRKDAPELIPSLAIGRFGVNHSSVNDLLGIAADDDSDVVHARVEELSIPFLNRALVTGIQFWDGEEWR